MHGQKKDSELSYSDFEAIVMDIVEPAEVVFMLNLSPSKLKVCIPIPALWMTNQ